MKLRKGGVYRTVGGWSAVVIWICKKDLQRGFYAIHYLGEEGESTPIYHCADGTAHSIFSVNEPPLNGVPHPADIVFKEV